MNEEKMWRQTSPLYQAFCREDEGDFLGEDSDYTAEVERANYE